MFIRVVPDQNQPSAAVEIPLEKPLPDYNLEQVEQPTPRDIDAILVSQGFRDLVDDARGVLTDLISGTGLEIAQFTGAICPDDEEAYRPGLWIVLHDRHIARGHGLSPDSIAHQYRRQRTGRTSPAQLAIVPGSRSSSVAAAQLDLSSSSPQTLISSLESERSGNPSI
jgi:hypothetical protein